MQFAIQGPSSNMTPTEHRPSFACHLVTNLPVKAERSRYPALRNRPLVIVEPGGDCDIVLDSSAEARGVVRGMTLGEALWACRKATVMQADHRYYRKTDDRIFQALQRRFGGVERGGRGRAHVRVDMQDAPYGEAHLVSTLLNAAPAGFGPRVGVGPGRFISYAMASHAPQGGTLRAPLNPVAFLSDCPVDLLPLSTEKITRLRRSGLHTLGSLTEVPFAYLRILLEADAKLARDLALGIDDTSLSGDIRRAA